MDMIVGLCVGVGLSASCGFRVFLPMLATSVASYSGYLELAEDLAWVGSGEALIAFAVASVVEVLAYYIPWFDNLLDGVAAPTAVLAGTLITASCIVDMGPLLQWSLALIAGGGTAGLFQTTTSLLRLASTAATGGLANPLISTIEAIIAVVLSLLSVLMPILAVCVVAVGFVVLFRLVRRLRRTPEVQDAPTADSPVSGNRA